MSRHNRERRLFRKLRNKGLVLSPYQLIRCSRHGKRKLHNLTLIGSVPVKQSVKRNYIASASNLLTGF